MVMPNDKGPTLCYISYRLLVRMTCLLQSCLCTVQSLIFTLPKLPLPPRPPATTEADTAEAPDDLQPPQLPLTFDAVAFSQRLWGEITYDADTRRFRRMSAQAGVPSGQKRSFVEFVLEPLYKLMGQTLGESEKDLAVRVGAERQE